MSMRALEDVLRRVERGETARTAVRLPGVPAGYRPAAQQPVLVQQEAPAPSTEDLKRWHEEGLASRMRAKADLAEIDDDYDEDLLDQARVLRNQMHQSRVRDDWQPQWFPTARAIPWNVPQRGGLGICAVPDEALNGDCEVGDRGQGLLALVVSARREELIEQ